MLPFLPVCAAVVLVRRMLVSTAHAVASSFGVFTCARVLTDDVVLLVQNVEAAAQGGARNPCVPLALALAATTVGAVDSVLNHVARRIPVLSGGTSLDLDLELEFDFDAVLGDDFDGLDLPPALDELLRTCEDGDGSSDFLADILDDPSGFMAEPSVELPGQGDTAAECEGDGGTAAADDSLPVDPVLQGWGRAWLLASRA